MKVGIEVDENVEEEKEFSSSQMISMSHLCLTCLILKAQVRSEILTLVKSFQNSSSHAAGRKSESLDAEIEGTTACNFLLDRSHQDLQRVNERLSKDA